MTSSPVRYILILLLLIAAPLYAQPKTDVQAVKIGDIPKKEIRFAPLLSAADTCFAASFDSIVWQIDNWVVGNELYKAYLDPANSCTSPYPYTIYEINMPMVFLGATDLVVSVDVEAVDLTDPSCPYPGDMLAISSSYQLTIPEAGFYSLPIPLDEPVVVDGPFFAGFFIGNELDPYVGAAVTTDNTLELCTGYNIWDTTLGFIDVNNNEYYSFPGRLVMYASGIPGGGSGGTTQPEPIVDIVSHKMVDTVLGQTELWARESSGSEIIDYVQFEYSNGGNFIEIGRDFDGTRPIRDGSTTSGAGNGYALNWDGSFLAEGNYTVRVTAVDTLGRSAQATATLYVEPTPPIPMITSPSSGEAVCAPVDLLVSSSDENMTSVNLFKQNGAGTFSAGLTVLAQADLGDANGDKFDGNLAANGEFGDYYSGPAAAAMAVEVWYNRGYTYLYSPPLNNLAEQLATAFHTRDNFGTYDEDMFRGLYDYFLPRGAVLDFEYKRNPDYFALRTWLEFDQRSVLLGVGGSPGLWATLDGFEGWEYNNGQFTIVVANPVTGLKEQWGIRNNNGTNEVYTGGIWHPLDIAISIGAINWNPTRTFVATDNNGLDGWSFVWDESSATDSSVYYLNTTAIDQSNIKGSSTVVALYDCSSAYAPGDYNHDGFTNFVDLNILIDFITEGGAAPVGGAIRADCNCDNNINFADIVYYLNFMYGTVAPPCH